VYKNVLKRVCDRGCAPDPIGGAYSATPRRPFITEGRERQGESKVILTAGISVLASSAKLPTGLYITDFVKKWQTPHFRRSAQKRNGITPCVCMI